MSLNMDWMYKKPTVDPEQYLLGKPIDKSYETMREDGCPTSNEDIGEKPGALFLEAAASAALEAEVKMREDPLYAIRKREEQARRELLNNPIRLKKMQEELERQRRKSEEKSGKVTEKDLLAKISKLKSKYGTSIKDLLSEEGNSHKKASKRRSRSRSRDHPRRRSSDRQSHSAHLSTSSRREEYPRYSDRSAESSHRRDARRTRSRSRSPRPYRDRSPQNSARKDSTRSSNSSSRPHQSLSSKPAAPTKAVAVSSKALDPAELERKRQEMMSAAKQRDEDRVQNVKNYKKKDEEEETRAKAVAQSGAGFIMPMMKSAVDGETLEKRINSSRKNIQRTKAALEKNFMER